MASTRRKISCTEIYHVMSHGVNKEKIFAKNTEREKMLSIFKEYAEKYDVEIYGYCIMNNHIHLLLKAQLEELSGYMQKTISEYAIYYNWKKERRGHVFQGRFKSECIENEAYYWNCLRYIHNNPVNANFIKDCENYKYSSMKEYLSGKKYLIHEKAFLHLQNRFGEIGLFRAFHKKANVFIHKDLPEEVWELYKKDARIIVFNSVNSFGIEEKMRFWDTPKLRNGIIQIICKELKISKKKAERLLGEIVNPHLPSEGF